MSNFCNKGNSRFYYLRRRTWENKGYTVLRTAGVFDLVAVPRRNNGPAVLLQCKKTKDKATARRMLARFQTNPPLPEGDHVQILEVGVTGERGGVVHMAVVGELEALV